MIIQSSVFNFVELCRINVSESESESYKWIDLTDIDISMI